ncbi:MAG: tyrosine-type recombinase/integrase [Limisphaerales bacterium]
MNERQGHLDSATARTRPAKPPKSPRLPSQWPHSVGQGDVKVRIYREKTLVRGKAYDTFLLAFYANGKRQRTRFTEFAKAEAEARRIAHQKSQGALGAAAMSANDRLAIENALSLLAATEGTGRATPARLAQIVADYATARAFLPPGAALADAAQFYATRHPANAPPKTVAEVAAEFVADRQLAGCSEIHLHDLKTRLQGQFARTFAVPIASLSANLVEHYINHLKREKDGKPASARSRENMLRPVVSLMNFARRRKYITADLAAEIADIPTPKQKPSPIGIYTPDEIRAMLADAAPDLIPALAVAAFAGLRLAEISRLDWKQVRLDERVIVVEANNSKTAARRLVPIGDNLAAWLTPHARPFGPVSPCTEETYSIGNALGNRFGRTGARAGVVRQRNALRHSYISYRVAVLKDVPAVALEAGNSPAIIFSSYRALATEAEGRAWFDVRPATAPENVLQMPATQTIA